jgi:hypothetical protein
MKRILIVITVVIGIIFYLSNKPIASIIEFWPLLLLLCPVMHIFMHGGHKHNKGSNNE